MDTNGVNQILQALDVVHAPRLSNAQRREAQMFLESVKQLPQSPYWGFQLASPAHYGRNPIVRHFGLLLLQHAVAKRFHTFDRAKAVAVREWIVQLAQTVAEDDPHYLKEKLAFLWALVAKRVWGCFLVKEAPAAANNSEPSTGPAPNTTATSTTAATTAATAAATAADSPDDLVDGWADMDSDLFRLWDHLSATRELSLIIVRTIFEDIYLLDDPVASRRTAILNQLCVLIVTPAVVLEQLYEPNPRIAVCKHADDGWFVRWSDFLVATLTAHDCSLAPVQMFVPKLLSTFKTCLHWVQPLVLRQQNIMNTLVNILALPDVKLKTLAVDCLHILFTRSYADYKDFEFFIGSIYSAEGIESLAQFYRSLEVDCDDIDEQVYALLKKTVEMIVSLSEYLNILLPAKSRIDWDKAAVDRYLNLVLATTNHPSLIISGLSLQMWVTTLRFDELSAKPPVDRILISLLEVAANRMISYTAVGDDNVSKKFLDLDFDLTMDAASFLSNYRKFNEDIVRITTCKKPDEGLKWLEARLEAFFGSELGKLCIEDGRLDEKSDAFNYGTSQFNIIENCIRGVSRWRIWYQGEDYDSKNNRLNGLVEALGERLLAMQLASPLLIRKQVQTMVQFAPLLKEVSPLMFKVLEKILTTATFPYPANISDEEREIIRDLRTSCGTELNRLAYIMPESLRKIFGELETVISNILSSNTVSNHENVAFKSFLLVIASRSSIDNKEDLFAKIVDPELRAWSAPETEKGLMDLHWFMERMGIVEIAQYFQKRNIGAETNLLEAQMDDEGRELKTKLKDRWSSIFPIRETRIFVQYSIEKLAHDSPEYLNLLKLWKPRVRPIIPHVLQLLTQIQAYHNPDNWRDLPEAVQSFLRYSRMERFWQQGVSIQSKETFIEESVKAALTLRDFADSVGHLIRYTREYAFLTIGSLSQLEDTLYEIPNIATSLWNALAGDTVGVTLHSWKHMINSCLRSVVKNCPIKYVDIFMTELLPKALYDLDKLIVERWDKVYMTGLQLQGNEDDATLSEEMMEEHMLRQLTATVVRLLIDIVPQVNAKNTTDTQFACKRIVCTNKEVMGAYLQICCHIIALKDTKCSFNTILAVRNLIPGICLKDDDVDKYLCDTLMKVLLKVSMDDYFVETHSETATALTTLYCSLRSKNDYPARILMETLPNITSQHVSNFETLLVGSRSLRHQRSALLELIRIAKSSEGEPSEEDDLKQRKKQLEAAAASRKKKALGSDLMNDPFTENGALTNLFGDE